MGFNRVHSDFFIDRCINTLSQVFRKCETKAFRRMIHCTSLKGCRKNGLLLILKLFRHNAVYNDNGMHQSNPVTEMKLIQSGYHVQTASRARCAVMTLAVSNPPGSVMATKTAATTSMKLTVVRDWF